MKTQHTYRAILVPDGGEDNGPWFISPVGNVGPAFFDLLPAGKFFAQKELKILEEIGVHNARLVKVRVTIEVVT